MKTKAQSKTSSRWNRASLLLVAALATGCAVDVDDAADMDDVEAEGEARPDYGDSPAHTDCLGCDEIASEVQGPLPEPGVWMEDPESDPNDDDGATEGFAEIDDDEHAFRSTVRRAAAHVDPVKREP